MTLETQTPLDDQSPVGHDAEGAASVSVKDVEHVYDNGFRALNPTTLDVPAGGFCTLLGPSGSGKTTLLRIIAGLLRPSGGSVLIGGRDVTADPIQSRDIGFVFQHYALFPHMTVAQNIAYPLKLRGVSKDERERRVAETLELVGLTGSRSARPDQLSGGQQQRVAVGRALVYRPQVLLLDEPLGALDRRLRQQLGTDLRRIQQETGITAVYVTHDQEEAFILSDDVVVMNHGEVRQQGTPESVYSRPRDLFVANFLGDTNTLAGTARVDGNSVSLETDGLRIPCSASDAVVNGEDVSLSVRPEDVRVMPLEARSDDLFVVGEGVVEDRVFLGARQRLRVRVGRHLFVAEAAVGGFLPEPGTSAQVGWPRARGVLVRGTAS